MVAKQMVFIRVYKMLPGDLFHSILKPVAPVYAQGTKSFRLYL